MFRKKPKKLFKIHILDFYSKNELVTQLMDWLEMDKDKRDKFIHKTAEKYLKYKNGDRYIPQTENRWDKLNFYVETGRDVEAAEMILYKGELPNDF